MAGLPLPTNTSPKQAVRFVEARIREGGDYIKSLADEIRYV
jgi:hypothetical protein